MNRLYGQNPLFSSPALLQFVDINRAAQDVLNSLIDEILVEAGCTCNPPTTK
jgi:hypothetical protein